MAKGKVGIPVEVTGADKAQADLKKTGQAVKGVGDAGKTSAAGTRAATGATEQHAAAQKKAGGATKKSAEAINQYDDSAKTALTGILGRFNPALAGLANIAVDVAKGIGKISTSLLGMIGVGVALSVVIAFFGRLRDKIAETKAQTDELIERWAKLRQQFGGAQESMADTLQRFGALTPATEKAAGEMRRRLERMGFKPTTAAAISPLAVMEGLSPADAALAAQLQVGGARFEKPGDIRKLLDSLRKRAPDTVAAAQRQIEELAKTETGKMRRAIAAGQPYGGVQYTPEERVYRGLQATGVISEETTLAEFRRNLDEAQRLTEGLRRLEERGIVGMERRRVYPGKLWGGRALITGQQIRERLRELQGPMLLEAVQGARAAGQSSVGAFPVEGIEVPPIIYINAPTTNMGVVYDSVGMVRDAFRADPDLLGLPPGAP